MRIHLGSDHAGHKLKEQIEAHLVRSGHDVVDVGSYDEDPTDYPAVAAAVGRAVASGTAERGVLVCGSGIGVAIAANKIRGVRAANVSDAQMARLARAHNDANIVTMGGRSISGAEAIDVVDAFLSTAFEGGRHQRRVDAIMALEDEGR